MPKTEIEVGLREDLREMTDSRDFWRRRALAAEAWVAGGPRLHFESRMTPAGDWVWRWAGEWNLEADAAEGRSIVENDAIQKEH